MIDITLVNQKWIKIEHKIEIQFKIELFIEIHFFVFPNSQGDITDIAPVWGDMSNIFPGANIDFW